MADKALYHEILQQLSIDYALCDGDLIVRASSSGLTHLVAGDTVIGRSLVDLFDEFAGLEEDLAEVCRGERDAFRLEMIQHVFASGVTGYVTLTVSSYDDGLLAVINDVTRLAEQQQHITQQRNELSIAHHRMSRLIVQMDDLLQRLVPALDLNDDEVDRDMIVPPAQMMTVVFANLEDIAAAAHLFDEERLLSMLDDRLALGVQRILSGGGHIDQFVGDAVMGLFTSSELGRDHAYHAVKAAWEFVHGFQGGYFNFSVGVSTGMARLAELEDGDEVKKTAIGDVTRQARILHEGASANQVIITADTYNLVQHQVEAQPAGEVVLTDNKTPIRLYQVLRLRE